MVRKPLEANAEGKPVAYTFITCLYDEIIRAMDIVPLWIEHYAGITAAKRDQERFLSKAEAAGFSRSMCTYATCGIGFDVMRAELGGAPPDAPWGGMARPDMMLGAGEGTFCEPRYKWCPSVQQYLPDVPFYALNIPWPVYDPDIGLEEVKGYYIKHLVEELNGLVEFLEKQTHRKMDWDRLDETVELGEKTYQTWEAAVSLCQNIPTPMGIEDEMNIMVPGEFMLGTPEALQFYQDLYEELKYRVDNKIGIVPEEKHRCLWVGGLPPWFALADFEYLKSKGVVVPAEAVYRPWWVPAEIPKTSNPLEKLAWRWFNYHTHWFEKARKRPGSHPTVERLIEYIEKYKIDGLIVHLAFSCRTWHIGLLWQLNMVRKLYGDIPYLILESDIVDMSSYSEAETHARMDAFVDVLETR